MFELGKQLNEKKAAQLQKLKPQDMKMVDQGKEAFVIAHTLNQFYHCEEIFTKIYNTDINQRRETSSDI